jgi:hypothetical protein
MLQFCRDQASAPILTIVQDIERSRDSEEGLDLASFDIPPIGGDLANGDAFVLWDALGRETYCPSLFRFLSLAPDDKTRFSIVKKMKALNTMSRGFVRDMAIPKKKASITSRLCALLSGQRPPSHQETSLAEKVCN